MENKVKRIAYMKPQIRALGSAVRVIEHIGVKPYPNALEGLFGQQPSYELDD
jgi:hypothetical protein